MAGSGISDAVFDAMVDELGQLSPGDDILKKVGAPSPKHSVWEKVRHEIPMGSLGKVNSEDEFREWTRGTGATEFFLTHKIDGSSMELIYRAGELVRAVTRGDGIVGEDVTANVSQIPSVPRKLKQTMDVTVRGEVVMFKEVFEELYADRYANPRNTAAGKVRDKKGGGADCRNLQFIAFWSNRDVKTMEDMVIELGDIGFRTPNFLARGSVEQVVEDYEVEKRAREKIPYEIDGMVVSVNSLAILDELGEHNMRPLGQTAWKFDPAMRVTKMVDVIWGVGPTGRIAPVAKVEPVQIGGVTITSVSLHNLSMFRELGLWKGCEVLVTRRNDVIPYISKNVSRDGTD